MENYTTIQAFIEVMNDFGVGFVFFNPGIDNVPLLETLAACQANGQPAPESILCLDEFVAMSAAHGAFMASGKPQVVSVHSELGIQQLGGSLHNAQWGRVPVVFFTENRGPSERTNWKGEAFDQAAMVRSFVKWDRDVTPDENPADILAEAFRIAISEPQGPVYLTLPRDMFWNKEPFPHSKKRNVKPDSLPVPDTSVLSKAADILIKAEDPLIVTSYAGRNPQSVPLLVELAETLAARVLTTDFWVSFPNTHPLSAFLPPKAGFGNPLLAKADTILAIDYDMHYAAPSSGPNPKAKIIHFDADIVKKGVPLWGMKPDILAKADSIRVIPALTAVIEKKLTPEKRAKLQKRYKEYASEHIRLDKAWQELAKSHAAREPISANWLSKCIDDIIDDDTIIVNQTISPSSIVAHTVHRTKPGTEYSNQGGCIGWAPGAALGVKLASPDKTIISLMGDGAFIYGCPEASLWSANFYKAPFLAVIYDNRGYGAIQGLFREKYDVANMGAEITVPPDYALIAKANNAYGRMVEDPAELPKALKDCLAKVRRGQAAVLDVRIDPV